MQNIKQRKPQLQIPFEPLKINQKIQTSINEECVIQKLCLQRVKRNLSVPHNQRFLNRFENLQKNLCLFGKELKKNFKQENNLNRCSNKKYQIFLINYRSERNIAQKKLYLLTIGKRNYFFKGTQKKLMFLQFNKLKSKKHWQIILKKIKKKQHEILYPLILNTQNIHIEEGVDTSNDFTINSFEHLKDVPSQNFPSMTKNKSKFFDSILIKQQQIVINQRRKFSNHRKFFINIVLFYFSVMILKKFQVLEQQQQ
ncbi:unnamed protein product [Paramecium sonneborni]|uniref:Transmembrane protein n=1 Tax=Paramecium sonneborni TaxID=65129 RepID=A0A8S1MP51_9CILI|nr:unnamed protein product [Paramecium sonneborni]